MTHTKKSQPQDSNVKKDFADYFTQIPLIISLLCDPYEEKLWSVYRRLAGSSHDKCYVSNPQLAILARMSEKRVAKCRTSLIEKGLIEGKLQHDDGTDPIWNIVIPDLWSRNTQLGDICPTVDDQIAFIKKHSK